LKQTKDSSEYEEGLDNLVNKYQLLNQKKVEIVETAEARKVILPLISAQEVPV